jgi:hypothetical protein
LIGDQIEIDFWHTNPDGMPHVSWASEIVQLFGTSSVPAIVAGSVLGVFELGERFASQRAKDALSKWLVSFDVQKAKALPDGTKELFERIFGERHFSLKCFVRSAAFSIGAMAFIMILYRVPEIVTRGRFPDGGESDSTWRTQEARHVGSDTIAPGF